VTKIRVVLIKSGIGYSPVQKKTLKALGLHKLNSSVIHEDSASFRGQVNRVRHLVKIEEAQS